jgi:tetrahydromethanopterin S-methyltransferase subunit G
LTFILLAFDANGQDQLVPYALAGRDRLIQVEPTIEVRLVALDKKIDKIEKNLNTGMDRLDDKFGTFFTRFVGLVLGAIIALFGFIICNCKTTLYPVNRGQYIAIEALCEPGKTKEQICEALKKLALW